MSFVFSAINWVFKGTEVDKTFVNVLHQAAESIGASGGRGYLVISGGKLSSSNKKSEETPFDKLTEFVNQKLKVLTVEEISTVRKDLSKIGEKMLRTPQAELNVPSGVLRLIILFSGLQTYGRGKQVCKYWNEQLDHRVRYVFYRAMVFTPQDWKTYWNVDVGESLPLSEEQLSELDQPCPYWEGKKKIQTHFCYYYPGEISSEKVKKQFLTIKSFREVIKHPADPSKESDFRYIWDQVLTDHGDMPNKISQWKIITRTVIPGSRGISYPDQQALVGQKPGYEVASLLPAIVGSEAAYAKTGGILYGQSPWTYLRTPQQSEGRQVCVGGRGVGASGLIINIYDVGYGNVGVAASAACGSSRS